MMSFVLEFLDAVADADARQSLWRLYRSRILPRTLGGSGAPEPLPKVALRAGDSAERGGEVVHGEAVGAKLVRGGEMLANVAGWNRRGVGEARENEQAIGGEFARIFRRGVVTRRKGAGQHLDEAGAGRRLQPAKGFDFTWRDEARDRHPAMLRLVDDFAERRELRARLLIDKLGKRFGAIFKCQGDEEEALAGMREGEVHSGLCVLVRDWKTDEVYTNTSCDVKWAA